MIAIIRIKGRVDIPYDMEETMNRLRVRKKFACVVVRESKEVLGMIEHVKNFIAYGNIDKETLIELLKKRAKYTNGKKIDAEKLAAEIMNDKVKLKIEDLGIKPFFALHPPRGGFILKEHYPKGLLGNNKEAINELIRRML